MDSLKLTNTLINITNHAVQTLKNAIPAAHVGTDFLGGIRRKPDVVLITRRMDGSQRARAGSFAGDSVTTTELCWCNRP